MMNAALRAFVRERAGRRCEYCRLHEDDADFLSFHLLAQARCPEGDTRTCRRLSSRRRFVSEASSGYWAHPRIVEAPQLQPLSLEDARRLVADYVRH
jgi:hypothetical protein